MSVFGKHITAPSETPQGEQRHFARATERYENGIN